MSAPSPSNRVVLRDMFDIMCTSSYFSLVVCMLSVTAIIIGCLECKLHMFLGGGLAGGAGGRLARVGCAAYCPAA